MRTALYLAKSRSPQSTEHRSAIKLTADAMSL
jgi:hypothetical protein